MKKINGVNGNNIPKNTNDLPAVIAKADKPKDSFKDLMDSVIESGKLDAIASKIPKLIFNDPVYLAGDRGYAKEYSSRSQRYERIVITPYRTNDPFMNNPNRGIERSYGTNIVCPVCGSNTCDWWFGRIQEDRAGEVLKDMMQGMFKGDGAYMGGNQEEYYQQRRGQSSQQTGRAQRPQQQRTDTTEDIDFEIVETEKKLKLLKNLSEAQKAMEEFVFGTQKRLQ